MRGAGGLKVGGGGRVTEKREQYLKKKTREDVKGHSAGVSDGRLRSLAQGYVFCSLFHVAVSPPLCGCAAFTLMHTGVFIIEQLRGCTCALLVCCTVTYSCCSVGGPPTTHLVLSSPIACQFAE